ncbi:SDR family oxidoreductase [Kutzneria sp. NPDC052558]|uniref:SDR family oxidoreductase n=1 Tax=Kutzneria sp. NPDC052558 TaxID=3364121 RepID=UPI0037CC3DD8
MHVFVTGATGWIGSAVVDQLIDGGHEVTGLARSDSSAAILAGRGAKVQRGDLDDLDSLRAGADAAEAVVHLANKHDFSDHAGTNAAERAAVQALGETLAGSHRRFVVASGLAFIAPGRVATELDKSPFHGVDSMRGGSENLALDFTAQGVDSIITRFAPTVHGTGDRWFLAELVSIARRTGVSAYVDEGANRWSAVHVADAAGAVRLALEKPVPAGTILHAVAETEISTRAIAEAIGRGLGLPVESAPEEHFGWVGRFFGAEMSAANHATRTLLDWTPTGLGLFEDLVSYF